LDDDNNDDHDDEGKTVQATRAIKDNSQLLRYNKSRDINYVLNHDNNTIKRAPQMTGLCWLLGKAI
jgi:hypothetical protein